MFSLDPVPFESLLGPTRCTRQVQEVQASKKRHLAGFFAERVAHRLRSRGTAFVLSMH